jgi:hypothetical protein
MVTCVYNFATFLKIEERLYYFDKTL